MRGRSLYLYLVLLLLSLFIVHAHADTVYFTFDSSVTSGLKFSVDSGTTWSSYVNQILSVTIGEDIRFYSVQTETTITFDLPSYHPGVTVTFDPVASGSNGPFPLPTDNYGAGLSYKFKTSITGNTVVNLQFGGDVIYFSSSKFIPVAQCTSIGLDGYVATISLSVHTLGMARGSCTYHYNADCSDNPIPLASKYGMERYFYIYCTGSTTSVSTYTIAIKEPTSGLAFLDIDVGSRVVVTGPTTIAAARCSSAFKISVTNNPSTITFPRGCSYYVDSSCSTAFPTRLTTNSAIYYMKCSTTGPKLIYIRATGQIHSDTTLSVVVPMDIVVTPSASCYKASTGKASLSVTGGPSSTYTYSWSTGQSTSSISNLAANNYTVTTTSGAISEETKVVITEAEIIITPTQTNVKCYGGSDGTVSVTVSGGSGSGYSYVWSSSGGTTSARTGLTAGDYTLTVTDSQGCSTQKTFTITQPAAALTFGTPVKTDILCPGGNTGTASMSVTGGTGTYKYSWSSNGGSANSATGLSAGTYTLTVTDDNQCSNQQSVTLTAPAAFVTSQSKIDPLCNGQASGTATATITSGGTSPYTYVWSNGAPNAPTATSLTPGSYSVVLSDANSCSITTMNYVISQPDPVIATTATVPVQCNGGATGKASVTIAGGTQPYTYIWSNGAITNSISNVAFGTYTVTISDANNCPVLPSASLSLSVTQPDVLSSSEVHTDVACNGRTTGTAIITVTGGTSPYQYSWSPQPSSITANGASATSLSAQTYTVTITDDNGCSIQQQIVISQPAALTMSTSPTHILCYGEQGSVSVTGSGGTTPYTYSWTSIGASTSSAKVSQPGSYAIVLTDAHGCTAQNTVVVNGPTAPLGVSIAKVDVRCNGGTTGSATPTVSGGTSGYTYAWSNGASSASISSLAAETYNLTVTDANACSATKSIVIKQGTAFESVAATVLNPKCYGGTGSITLLPLGGTTPYTYEWFPVASSDGYVDQLSQGVYVAYIIDACSIKRTKNFVITEPNALEVIPSQSNVACYGDNSGSASVHVIGGKTPYSYLWSNGKTTAAITGLSAGSYDITVTDKNGCLQQASFIITQPDPVLVTPTVTPVMCKGGNSGAISLLTTGGSTRYTYQWAPSSGGFSSAINHLTAGSYSVIVTDTAFCSQQQTYVVNEPSALVITPSQVNVMCKGGSTGSISIVVSGGTPGYVYSWTPNVGSGTNLTKLSAGKYVVTVTDANGCSLSSNFTITEPASTCKNGGACSGVDQCLCGKGWNGTDCSIPVCSSPCLNKGTCVAPDTCSCTSDMTGPVCIIPTATTKAWWTVKLVQVYKQESSVSPTTYGEMLAENMNIPSTAVVVSTQESASLYAKKSMPYIKLICIITLNETGTSINRTKELVLLAANSENITKYLEDSYSDSHTNYIDAIDLLTQSLVIESPSEEKPKSNSNRKRVGLGVGLGLGIPVVAAAIGGVAYFGYKKKAVTYGNSA